MQRMKIAAAILAAMALLTAGSLTAAPAGSRWGANYFPNVPLTTHEGKTVHFYDDLLKGKTVAIYLMYTTCQYSCPLETARLAQVQRYLGDRVGKDIFFYSISIDPKHDTPEVLKGYAEKYHAGPGWVFLTGKAEDIELISKKLGLYSEPDPSNKDGHTPSLLVGNEPTGQWMRNSALDNPRFLSIVIANWLNGWKNNSLIAEKSYDNAPALSLNDKGHYLFATKCAACHTIGHGDSVGPDLLGVTRVREHVWLAHFIQKPADMVAAGDPIATALFTKYKQVRMPNLGLADEAVNYVIDYLATHTTASHVDASAGAMPDCHDHAGAVEAKQPRKAERGAQ